MAETAPHPPQTFAAAVESIRSAPTRPELIVTEIPAPSTLAPWSFALAADVSPRLHGADSELGTGRFVVLYDPDEPDAWGGAFRVICYAQAPLETEMGVDPFLAEVAWSWLEDALRQRGASHHSASGTATRILSTGFGELARQGDGAQLELRASWTAQDSALAPHVESWGDLLCMLAGIPPTPEGVSVLSSRRVGRD